MKAWLREHVLALADGLLRLRRQFVAAILNVLVIGVAMSLPVGLYVVLNNVAGLVQRSASEPQMTLFLDVDVPAADREAIRERLARAVGRGRFEFIPKDQALEGLRRTAGLSDVVEELGQNPLPDAFVVTGRADDAAGLESLRAEAEKWPG
ncbi:MAG: permease-like cell division protein FtsX, partial [Planctomycetes bacterium]|nr:permease-like cell division protein FtsX [Planctomycetota bacterium]